MLVSTKRQLISFFLAVFFVIAPLATYAQDGIVPCGPQQGNWCELKDLFGLLVSIYNFLLGTAGIVAFGLLIWGGVQMILSSVDEEKLKNGKTTVTQALIGLVIILLAYVIVNTVLLVLGISGGATEYFSGAKFFGN